MSLTYNPLLFFGFDNSGAPPSTGANTALSNLSSPTAISEDLLPGVDNSLFLGDQTHRFSGAFITNLKDSSGLVSIAVASRRLQGNGIDKVNWENDGLSLITTNNGEILLAPNGSGQIRFNDTSVGNAGYVWTASDAFGRGHWAALSAVTTMAAVGASPSANGASISGSTLTLQPADATHPGVLTTGAQSLAGAKTFSGDLLSSGASLGSSGSPWPNIFGAAITTGGGGTNGTITFRNSAAVARGTLTPDGTMSNSGTAVALKLGSSVALGHIGIDTADSGTFNTNSGSVIVETGDQTNGAGGASGSIVLRPGTSTGTRGKIQIVDGTEGTANYAWTSSDSAGNGRWTNKLVIQSGATGSRPGGPVTGQMYFDTDLTIPIWYSGSNWVNASGATV